MSQKINAIRFILLLLAGLLVIGATFISASTASAATSDQLKRGVMVRTIDNLTVRNSYIGVLNGGYKSMFQSRVGVQPAGSVGEVNSAGAFAGDGRQWVSVEWEDGMEGWSVIEWLEVISDEEESSDESSSADEESEDAEEPALPEDQELEKGDTVRATDNLSVRSGSGIGSYLIDTMPAGSLGTVQSSHPLSGNGYQWMQIVWEDCTKGWSVVDYMEVIKKAKGNDLSWREEILQYSMRRKMPLMATGIMPEKSRSEFENLGLWDEYVRVRAQWQAKLQGLTEAEREAAGVSVLEDLVVDTSSSSCTPKPTTFSLNDIDTVTRTFVDPYENMNGDSYDLYLIDFDDEERAPVVVKAYSVATDSQVRNAFRNAGYTGDIDDLLDEVVTEPGTDEDSTDEAGDGTGFEIGDTVSATTNLNVRFAASLGARSYARVTTGMKGTILRGPVESGGYIWYQIRWTNGNSGWSAGNWLELSSAKDPDTVIRRNERAKFSIGDRIEVVQTGTETAVNVRSLAGTGPLSRVLGTQPIGATGSIVGGPTNSSDDGYTWWYVNYDSGADGFSVESSLEDEGTTEPDDSDDDANDDSSDDSSDDSDDNTDDSSFDIDDVASVVNVGNVYTITLNDGTQFTVARTVFNNPSSFRQYLRNQGYTGDEQDIIDMSDVDMDGDGTSDSVDTSGSASDNNDASCGDSYGISDINSFASEVTSTQLKITVELSGGCSHEFSINKNTRSGLMKQVRDSGYTGTLSDFQDSAGLGRIFFEKLDDGTYVPMTSETNEAVYNAYVEYLGRIPDVRGFTYWTSRYPYIKNSAYSLENIFKASVEYSNRATGQVQGISTTDTLELLRSTLMQLSSALSSLR